MSIPIYKKQSELVITPLGTTEPYAIAFNTPSERFQYRPTDREKQPNGRVQRRLVTFASPSRTLNCPLQHGCCIAARYRGLDFVKE